MMAPAIFLLLMGSFKINHPSTKIKMEAASFKIDATEAEVYLYPATQTMVDKYCPRMAPTNNQYLPLDRITANGLRFFFNKALNKNMVTIPPIVRIVMIQKNGISVVTGLTITMPKAVKKTPNAAKMKPLSGGCSTVKGFLR